MIAEEIIDSIVEKYIQNTEYYEESLNELMDSQPALLAFLTQESSEVLTEEEKDIAWYLVLIIIRSCQAGEINIEELADVFLSENEETNWEVYQETPKGFFRDRITPLFKNYEQEDLLAFVEDSLEIDDDSPITPVGREVVFIMTKSVIDTIFKIKK
ncbi:MAG: hypothetical protein V3V14_04100 [Saprospiraceae bacterium]